MQYIILAPANAETGGVEDLHQLYRGLKLAGQQVKMAYINNCAINSLKEWAPKQFMCRPSIPLRYSYCGPFELADDIPDTADTVVIAPEIFQCAVLPLKNALPCVWALAMVPLVPEWKGRRVLPIGQSHYAMVTFQEQGLTPLYLPDYLSPQIVNNGIVYQTGRVNGVVYFGGRGCPESKLLLQQFPGVESRSFFGLNTVQLDGIYKEWRHFIYPVRQPGMDKTPREAAVNGCVVWVLASGAAEHYYDAPLDSRFRCLTTEILVSHLRMSLQSEERYHEDFAAQGEYRDWIRDAPARFDKGVLDLIARTADML